MTLVEAAPLLTAGQLVRRAAWQTNAHLRVALNGWIRMEGHGTDHWTPRAEDLIATDWETYTAPVIGRMQFRRGA